MSTEESSKPLIDTCREKLFSEVDFKRMDDKLLQISEKLTENNETVSKLENKISKFQMQLEKFSQDVNRNFVQGVKDGQRVHSEIPEQLSPNVRERKKRKTRIVLFNVSYKEKDMEDKLIEGLTDFDLVLDLMQNSNLNFQPKFCFRVLSENNADIQRPPLIIDFFTVSHKYKFMTECRSLIREFRDNGMRLIKNTRPRIGVSHWINDVTMAADRSYADRNTYKVLKELMIARNGELLENGTIDKIWIIKDLTLCLIDMQQREN